jgi:PPOX class probable F420-dependent enzyme
MASLEDPPIQRLLEEPNFAVVSTLGENGEIDSSVVWVSREDGDLAVNSAVGRKWPTNLERDARVNVLVIKADDPYEYVEIRGRAEGTTEGADQHIDELAQKYINQEKYPFRQPGEQRKKFIVHPDVVRYQKQ